MGYFAELAAEHFREEIERIRNEKDFDGKHSIPLNHLFPMGFMLKYTSFSSIFDFIEKFPYKVQAAAEIDALPKDEIDSFISKHTSFETWESMQSIALNIVINSEDELGF